MTSEASFKKKVMKDLKQIPNSWFFSKEALAIRGIPDIIGLVNGRFVALELKKNEAEAKKTTGRIALQKHNVQKILGIGGIAAVVYPGIWADILVYIQKTATLKSTWKKSATISKYVSLINKSLD